MNHQNRNTSNGDPSETSGRFPLTDSHLQRRSIDDSGEQHGRQEAIFKNSSRIDQSLNSKSLVVPPSHDSKFWNSIDQEVTHSIPILSSSSITQKGNRREDRTRFARGAHVQHRQLKDGPYNISEETLSSKSSSSFSIPRANEEHTLSTSTASSKGNRNDESHSSSQAFTNNLDTDHCSSTMSELFPWKKLTEVELNAFNQRQDSTLLPGWGNAISHHGIRTSGGNRSTSIGGLGIVKNPGVYPTDPLGLPYPIDDVMGRDNLVQSRHTAVVARHPPPDAMVTSSGSSDNCITFADAKLAVLTKNHYPNRRVLSSSLDSWNNVKKSPSSSISSKHPSKVAPSKRCHDQMTKTFPTQPTSQEKSPSVQSKLDQSNGFGDVKRGNLKNEDQLPLIKSRMETSAHPDLSKQTSNSSYTKRQAEDCSSSSGSDGGYAASASSNDNGAHSYPSTSSDDEDRHNTTPNPNQRGTTKSEGGVKRPHESPSSSDLADFSSGSTEVICNDPISSHFTSHLESDSCSRWLLSLGKPLSTSSEGSHSNAPKDSKCSTSRAKPVETDYFPRKRSMHEGPSAGLDACKNMARNMGKLEFSATSTYSTSKSTRKIDSGCEMTPSKRKKESHHEVHQRKFCTSFTYALRRKTDRNHPPPMTTDSSREKNKEKQAISVRENEGLKIASLNEASSPTSIYDVGVDIMANILTHLEPTEIYTILSTPISKTWRATFTTPDDLWKVLCLSGPFYAKLDTAKDESSDDSSRPICKNTDVRHLFGYHRLLYCSFHRCNLYLEKIKQDSIRGLGMNDNETDAQHLFSGNSSLQDFFARARNFTVGGEGDGSRSDAENSGGSSNTTKSDNSNGYISARDGPERKKKKKGKSKIKFAQSSLTKKLLGPVHGSLIAGSYTSLPYSCAIYSIVNYMISFIDVVGIQIMCLKVLPHLLEDERQRTAAQHAGLTDTVLRAMVLFPDDIDLHTSAFHTLVLLARPLGKKEGMILFRRTMLNESRMFKAESRTSMSGIAVMLDSMRRFASNASLQAMSCWSMVNIALIPSQKVVLVKLGGIAVAANAMLQHPHNPEVQFRALFALINLVIPSENLPENSTEADVIRQQVGEVNDRSEREMLEESIDQIVNLVVVAMRNFCSSEAILNRSCLVLHNLSLNANYHGTLLHTPNCYQMLQWCLVNYRNDSVLQKSAGGTLQRLDQTLSNDDELRAQFLECMRSMARNVATENNNNND